MHEGLRIAARTVIPVSEVDVRTSRSSGPGGQHANVTASRVQASLDLTSCTGIDEDQRHRLTARFGPRVTASAQDSRSQSRNRDLALARLEHRLAEALVIRRPRHRTKPSKATVARRVEAKRRQSERKRGRRPPGAQAE
jgi:ribosome-associated protein